VVLGLALAMSLGALLLLGRPASGAAVLQAGFTQALVATGFQSPTTMEFAPDGRIFVAEQAGKLRVVKAGRLLATPALDISGRVDSSGERGLLGVAFDPNFSQNGFVYLYYTIRATTREPAHNRVVRFTASGHRLLPATEKLLLRLNNLSTRTNHNGGAIHFGQDGKLYVAVGENANTNNAQTFGNLLGKMLRINKDGTIPSDNPYFANDNVVGKNKAIWARGLRNPYSFAVQPGTGRIYNQRRGRPDLGGDQPRSRGRQLRVARLRRARVGPALRAAGLRLQARQHRHDGVRDHRRRLLRPPDRTVSGRLRGRLLLRGLLRRVDPAVLDL